MTNGERPKFSMGSPMKVRLALVVLSQFFISATLMTWNGAWQAMFIPAGLRARGRPTVSSSGASRASAGPAVGVCGRVRRRQQESLVTYTDNLEGQSSKDERGKCFESHGGSASCCGLHRPFHPPFITHHVMGGLDQRFNVRWITPR